MAKFLPAVMIGVLALLAANTASGGAFRAGENLRRQQIYLPASTPEAGELTLVDNAMYVDDEGVAGILVYYDDARTHWEVDYIEFYDLEGELLLVAWIDRYGVCRVAMDRGLLDADHPTVEGTLVIVHVGRFL